MGEVSKQVGGGREGCSMQLRQRLISIQDNRMPYLKKLFWAYLLLLIFEGALRKWVAPQLSAPLLVIRDPIGMLIIAEAISKNKWPERWSIVTGFLTVGLICLCVIQMVVGGNSWAAAAFGLRSYLLPFPVAFIMGENLDAEDLRKMGVCMMWILLPMTVLEVAQYLAPATSLLNAGAYKGATQIRYVGGHARASGTFSYVAGPAMFNTLVAAFVLYGFAKEGFAKKWLLAAAAFSIVLSVPVIGSRGLLYTLIEMLACIAIAAMSGVRQFGQVLKVAVPALIVSSLVTLLPVFSEASMSMRERIAQGRGSEGSTAHSIVSRTVEPIYERLAGTDLLSNPIGIGLGRGAAAISALQGDSRLFLAGESEFDRAINEMGPLTGIIFELFCIFLTIMIVANAVSQVRTEGEPLALLLIPSVVGTLFFGVMEQPMEQGFMVLSVAIALTALRQRGAPGKTSAAPNGLAKAEARRQGNSVGGSGRGGFRGARI